MYLPIFINRDSRVNCTHKHINTLDHIIILMMKYIDFNEYNFWSLTIYR